MGIRPIGFWLLASLTLVGFAGSPALAQLEPWDLFLDGASSSACDVVNAENAELVVLTDTGQLMLVSQTDVLLVDTFVNLDGDVFLGDDPVGFIDFAVDGDGFRTLWWLSLTGRVVHVDGFTGEPTETSFLPADFFDIPCDACPFWDDPTVCGVPDDADDSDDSDGLIFPPIMFNFCGLGASLAMALTAVGLLAMGFVQRRLG